MELAAGLIQRVERLMKNFIKHPGNECTLESAFIQYVPTEALNYSFY